MSDSQTEIDVFGEGSTGDVAEPATAAVPPPEPAPRAKAPPKAGKKGAGMPSWMILAVVGLAGMVWVFWPSSPRAPRRLSAATMAAPAQSVEGAVPDRSGPIHPAIPARLESQYAGKAAAPVGEAPLPVQTPASEASAPASPQMAITKDAPAVPTVSAVSGASQDYATRNQFATLDAQVKQDAETLGEVQVSVKQLAVQVQAGAGRKPAARLKERGGRKVAEKKTPALVHALNGDVYTLMSLSRGVAWIQAGDHIEIVQPGDRIGNTRVLVIDPVARRVVTADGVIR